MGVGLGGNVAGYTDPYWNPSPTTGDNYDWGDTDFGRMIQEQNTNVAYNRKRVELGIGGPDSGFGRWFAGQFPQFQLGYGSETASHPLTTNVVDYLNSLGGPEDWQRRYMNTNPMLRGEDAGSRGGGPVRWIHDG